MSGRGGGRGGGDRLNIGGRGAGGPPNRPEQGKLAGPGGRGIPRPPPGFWGPRGPPPPGHPAWNDPALQQYIPRHPGNGEGDIAAGGRPRGGPGFFPPRGDGLGRVGEMRGPGPGQGPGPGPGNDGPPPPFDAVGAPGRGQGPPPWAAAGGLPPRGFGRNPNPGLPPVGGRGQGGGRGRGAPLREEDRGPPPPHGEGPWRPMGAGVAPWENGRGDGIPPEAAGAAWGPGGRRGGGRMGPEGGMQG